MNIQNVARSARLYARSEAMVVEILLRVYARKVAFVSIALLASAVGLGFLNLAGFFYLQSIWGPVWTPLALSLANFGIAAIAILVAVFAHPGPDLAMAKELRNVAGQALDEEVRSAGTFGGMAGTLGHSGDAGIGNLLLPAVIAIVSSIAKRKASAKKQP